MTTLEHRWVKNQQREILYKMWFLWTRNDWLVKAGGSFSCSNHGTVEFKILRGGNKAKSRIINLDFRRAHFGLFLVLLRRIPWETSLEKKWFNFQGSSPPSSRTIRLYIIKQRLSSNGGRMPVWMSKKAHKTQKHRKEVHKKQGKMIQEMYRHCWRMKGVWYERKTSPGVGLDKEYKTQQKSLLWVEDPCTIMCCGMTEKERCRKRPEGPCEREDRKVNMSKQCAITANTVKNVIGCIRRGVSSRLMKVIYSALATFGWLDPVLGSLSKKTCTYQRVSSERQQRWWGN